MDTSIKMNEHEDGGDSTLPKIAVVGAGGWGSNHVRVWNDLGNLGLVYDLDPIRQESVKAQ